MKEQYASMPKWLFNALGITEGMDKWAFRQHDHDYGVMGYTRPGYNRANTRSEADRWLRDRLICSFKLAPWKAWLIWLGCRLLKGHKWRVGRNVAK